MAAEHVRALGDRIRLRREELGMTQDEVARQMSGSVDGQRISKWERGENRPRDESLEELARVLKTTATALLVPATKTEETPTPFAHQDAFADRLKALEQRVADQLAEHAQRVEGLLDRQSRVLERIEAAIDREDQAAARRDAESARLLAEAVQQALRALEDDAQETG